MPPAQTMNESFILPRLRYFVITEGAAGDHTVTGIRTVDRLVAVIGFTLVLSEAAPPTMAFTAQNLTDEFTITAADTINNGGGTALTDGVALVIYLDTPEEME